MKMEEFDGQYDQKKKWQNQYICLPLDLDNG
jgi:hypothetical protein